MGTKDGWATGYSSRSASEEASVKPTYCLRLSKKVIGCLSLVIAVGVAGLELAAEGSVEVREREGDQDEGDGPPAESDAHRVRPGRRRVNRERAPRIAGRRQQHREEGEGGAAQHRRQVDDRGGE